MDSVFDDRERAIEEAEKIDQSTRYSGVRVIEENYDEATDKTACRTLFRGGTAKSDNTPQKEAPAGRSAPTGGAEGKRGAGRKAKKSNPLVLILILVVVVIGGLAALFGLQQLSALK